MKKINLFFLLIVCLFLTNCASAHKDQYVKRGLTQSFDFKEITERGETIDLADNMSIYQVDINSSIDVQVHPERFSVSKGRISSPQLRDISGQRESLMEMLKLIDEYIALSEELERIYIETHDAGGRRLEGIDSKLADLDRKEKEQSKTGESVLDKLKEYIAEKYNIKAINKADLRMKINKKLSDLGLDIASIKDEKLAAFLKREVQKMDEETRNRTSRITESANKEKLRIESRLYHKGEPYVPLHVPGYDNREAGDPSFVDRLSFRLDEKAKKELKKEIEFHSDFAEVYNNLRKESSNLKETVSETLNAFGKDVNNFIESFPLDDLKAMLIKTSQDMIKELDQLENDLTSEPESKARIVQLKAEIASLEAQWKSLYDSIGKLQKIRLTEDVNAAVALVDLPQLKVNELNVVISSVLSLFDKKRGDSVQNHLQEMRRLLEEIQTDQNIKNKLSDMLVESIKQSFPETMNALESHMPNLEKYVKLARGIIEFAEPVKYLASIAEDDMIVNVPLDEVQDTELQIVRSPRREGDIIEFNAKIINKDGKIAAEGSRLFKVTKFGLHSNVSANVIFVDRISNPSGEKEVNFVAAPAASYTFRYRTRKNSSAGKFWNVFNPGLGLNVAALNFESSGVEIGVAPTLSLFSDIIQIGYGWNLQVDSDHEYYFIGIGLLEMYDAFRNPQVKLQ